MAFQAIQGLEPSNNSSTGVQDLWLKNRIPQVLCFKGSKGAVTNNKDISRFQGITKSQEAQMEKQRQKEACLSRVLSGLPWLWRGGWAASAGWLAHTPAA